MKRQNMSRGSAGGVILIIVGVLLSVFLLGTIISVYKNSPVGQSVIGGSTTPPKKTTGSYSPTSTIQTGTNQTFTTPSTDGCSIVVKAPMDGQAVAERIRFSGYLTNCVQASVGESVGNVALYRYSTQRIVGTSMALIADDVTDDGQVNFNGILEQDSSRDVEQGYLLFKFFRKNGTQGTLVRTVYF